MSIAPHRGLLFVVAGIVGVLMVVGQAHAIPPGGASADTPGTSASVSPRTLAAGDRISFTLGGFPAGETVFIKIDDGEACDQAAVHGACVYHQQKIASDGTVSGSFTVPAGLAPGAHWLRFLASEEIRVDGEYRGVKGYTRRGGSDFTIVRESGGRENTSASPSAGGTPTPAGTADTNATEATPTAEPSTAAGGVVTVAPDQVRPAPVESAPPTAPEQIAPAAEPTVEAAAVSDTTRFPTVGVFTLAGAIVIAAFGSGFLVRRRRG